MSNYGEEPQRRVHCPSCARIQRVDTLFEKIDKWDDDGAGVQGINEYYVFECRGCETVFFSRCTKNSEDWEMEYDHRTGRDEMVYPYRTNIWPKPWQPKVQRINRFSLYLENGRVASLLDEFYNAIDSELWVLAAIGARTTFDSVSEHLGVDPALSFADKLIQLLRDGYISGKEKGSLEILVDAGGAAAHRGWSPSLSDLETVANILNSFIERTLLRPNAEKGLKERVPPKN